MLLACPLAARATSTSPSPPGVLTPAPVMLANSYRPGMALADYWVSEKYDGVRGYWDGRQLFTRGGTPIQAPAWFTAGWPAMPIDGELWAGRGQFSQAVSTVRQLTPDEHAWRSLRFMAFDLPGHGGPFSERIPALQEAVKRIGQPWVLAVPQQKVAGAGALQALLAKTVRLGGEGLMLHRGASLYQAVRSDDLLKLKTHEDAEAPP
jgi:DNA ligase-1